MVPLGSQPPVKLGKREIDALSEREIGALRVVATLGNAVHTDYGDNTGKQVAAAFNVSIHTAKQRFGTAYEKLYASDVQSAVCIALETGLLHLEEVVNGCGLEGLLQTLSPFQIILLKAYHSCAIESRCASRKAVLSHMQNQSVGLSSIEYGIGKIYELSDGVVSTLPQLAVLAYYASHRGPQDHKPF